MKNTTNKDIVFCTIFLLWLTSIIVCICKSKNIVATGNIINISWTLIMSLLVVFKQFTKFGNWLEHPFEMPSFSSIFNAVTFNKYNKKLITEVLDNPFNARGFYKGTPQYFYNGYWYVLNEQCNRILIRKKIGTSIIKTRSWASPTNSCVLFVMPSFTYLIGKSSSVIYHREWIWWVSIPALFLFWLIVNFKIEKVVKKY